MAVGTSAGRPTLGNSEHRSTPRLPLRQHALHRQSHNTVRFWVRCFRASYLRSWTHRSWTQDTQRWEAIRLEALLSFMKTSTPLSPLESDSRQSLCRLVLVVCVRTNVQIVHQVLLETTQCILFLQRCLAVGTLLTANADAFLVNVWDFRRLTWS